MGLCPSQTDRGENKEVLQRKWPNRRKVENLKIRFIAYIYQLIFHGKLMLLKLDVIVIFLVVIFVWN